MCAEGNRLFNRARRFRYRAMNERRDGQTGKSDDQSSALLSGGKFLFSKRFSLLSARKSPCSAAKSNLPQPFEFARRSGTNIAVEDRILKTSLYFALLPENRPPQTGSHRPASSASQSLFLRGFMVLTPNAREHGACARGGSVSVSQSRAGSSRFGALSLRANFGVSFLVALR